MLYSDKRGDEMNEKNEIKGDSLVKIAEIIFKEFDINVNQLLEFQKWKLEQVKQEVIREYGSTTNKNMYVSGDFTKDGKMPKIVFAGNRCVYYERYDANYNEYFYKTLCGNFTDNKSEGEYCPFCGCKIVIEECER